MPLSWRVLVVPGFAPQREAKRESTSCPCWVQPYKRLWEDISDDTAERQEEVWTPVLALFWCVETITKIRKHQIFHAKIQQKDIAYLPLLTWIFDLHLKSISWKNDNLSRITILKFSKQEHSCFLFFHYSILLLSSRPNYNSQCQHETWDKIMSS